MIGWAQSRRDGWRTRSRHAQAEASIRWSLIPLPWFLPLIGLAPLPARAGDSATAHTLVWAIIGLNVVMSATSSLTVRRALDAYVGLRPVSWRGIALLGVQLAGATALTVALVAVGGLRAEAAEAMVLLAPTGAFVLPFGLLASVRTMALTLAGLITVYVAAFGFVGMDGGDLTGLAVSTALGGLGMAFSSRCSGWYVAVMRELDETREVQSRLAVAEERLRFGRDLHDVLGRNLSVIALKSELAVQLARRGGEPETAVSQMVEVQRIARDSQREVREVVRGYREADLATELAGARGVLRAAGIDCRADGDGGDGGATRLPEPVRAALGWVVREGTTNVLRHADATHCVIAVRREGAEAVLTMENDGAVGAAAPDGDEGRRHGGRAGGGAGLTGLRERLAALDGALTADRPAPTTFRLTARIPLHGAALGEGGRRHGPAAETTSPPLGTADGPSAPPRPEPVTRGPAPAARQQPGRPVGGETGVRDAVAATNDPYAAAADGATTTAPATPRAGDTPDPAEAGARGACAGDAGEPTTAKPEVAGASDAARAEDATYPAGTDHADDAGEPTTGRRPAAAELGAGDAGGQGGTRGREPATAKPEVAGASEADGTVDATYPAGTGDAGDAGGPRTGGRPAAAELDAGGAGGRGGARGREPAVAGLEGAGQEGGR